MKERAAAFKNLKVVYRFGSSPRLLLRGEKAQKETLRIDKWKTEQIEEYLRDKLVEPSSADA